MLPPRWLGHVKIMEVGAMPRRMMEARLFIGRRKGRPRLRWMDDVVADLRVMKIRQRRWRIGSSGNWLSRRPRLTQGCSVRRMDGWTRSSIHIYDISSLMVNVSTVRNYYQSLLLTNALN